ncbi:MAG TPA: hypothetical protein P5262_02545 [Candidatus Moranbacteria bacterium]|nr:hypothetical protein [Candidatus Moranbacteria bacterium]
MNEETNKNEYVTRKDLEEQTQILLSALDNRLNQMEDRLRTDINNVQALIDGYVKAQEDFKQEFTIMREEFKQMKQIIKEKLGIEIKAIG